MTTFGGGLHGAHVRTELVTTLGRYGVRRAVHEGTLRPLWPRVLVETARLTALHTRAAAAQLSCGPRSALAGPTAAELHGCAAMATPRTHVLLPYGHDTRQRNGLVVRHGRPFAEQVVEIDGLRVLALDHVVAELLCRAQAARDALAVADQALALQPESSRGRFRMRIFRCIEERPDPRGTRRARMLLDLATGHTESPAESWLHLLIVELGFPHPEANWSICAPDGREIYRLDLAWPDLRIAVEYDGYAAHVDRAHADEARDEDLRRRGWIVVRVTVDDLSAPTQLAHRLRDAFSRRGYTW